ncbi:hypothetical protein ABE28_003865 [Peribacillus muralis]|uniref:Conserved hypothetical protein CHP03032 domain-containing protein n=1 Tax=Peribacillus muralis TaxID=264697 RepID=A0A1B3XJT2_9BACI|nr:DUF4915 domain-containing protein [Peribacillus muralis]AOH53477.1 hypothetical protein ABE28_003865 [Peribacillus muralis]
MIPIDDCKLLVSCCNHKGGLYSVQIQHQQYEMKKILNVGCTGMARYGSSFVVISNSHGIFILDENLKVIKNKPLSTELDLHGLAIDNDKAYIVETKTNSIGIYHLKNDLKRMDEIRISPENFDVSHVNDLYIVNDTLYLSMFSNPLRKSLSSFSSYFPYKPIARGVILEYSLQERNIIKICHDKLYQPHSVLHHDNNLFYCVSGEFLVKRNEEDIFKCLGYTRGLAVKNQTMFIGQSESRHIETLLKKHTNVLLDCGIYVHDISTKLSSFIHIPSEEIYGILVI